jgi:aminopeptidase N
MKAYLSVSLSIGACFLFGQPLNGQNQHDHRNTIDVQHYRFEIDLNDTTDILYGTAEVEILFMADIPEFNLDLVHVSENGLGMHIDGIEEDGKEVRFTHTGDQVSIALSGTPEGATKRYLIRYHGVPADGLIIAENRFGDRTFFGDNWPDRARHWLPVVDHPSDKATVEFLVEAPVHYGIVSNGALVEEIREGDRVVSHWKTAVPLPTKLMVIGVSPFAVEHLTSRSGVPVSSWVYPQNREEGFSDFRDAIKPLDWYESYIAPYPYSKLANVQSTTRFGGMENASCIFYHERAVTGKKELEPLLAHEIAHQWFGDAVSEREWHHIWLSEGFATYLADLYLEHEHGRDAFVASMQSEKEQVLDFARKRRAPVVDTTLPVSFRLLNTNSYEKAGWVLHMLRRELGDDLFQKCLQAFYQKFKFGNALTDDFRIVVDSLSGLDFKPFFDQWIFTAGHPVLSAAWAYHKGKITLVVRQHQEPHLFHFPLDIRIGLKDGSELLRTLQVSRKEETCQIASDIRPASIMLDPDLWLLFELH